MYPEPKSEVFETNNAPIVPMQEKCLSCGDVNSIHSKEQLEKCSLVWNVKIHNLEYKLKLRALQK